MGLSFNVRVSPFLAVQLLGGGGGEKHKPSKASTIGTSCSRHPKAPRHSFPPLESSTLPSFTSFLFRLHINVGKRRKITTQRKGYGTCYRRYPQGQQKTQKRKRTPRGTERRGIEEDAETPENRLWYKERNMQTGTKAAISSHQGALSMIF